MSEHEHNQGEPDATEIDERRARAHELVRELRASGGDTEVVQGVLRQAGAEKFLGPAMKQSGEAVTGSGNLTPTGREGDIIYRAVLKELGIGQVEGIDKTPDARPGEGRHHVVDQDAFERAVDEHLTGKKWSVEELSKARASLEARDLVATPEEKAQKDYKPSWLEIRLGQAEQAAAARETVERQPEAQSGSGRKTRAELRREAARRESEVRTEIAKQTGGLDDAAYHEMASFNKYGRDDADVVREAGKRRSGAAAARVIDIRPPVAPATERSPVDSSADTAADSSELSRTEKLMSEEDWARHLVKPKLRKNDPGGGGNPWVTQFDSETLKDKLGDWTKTRHEGEAEKLRQKLPPRPPRSVTPGAPTSPDDPAKAPDATKASDSGPDTSGPDDPASTLAMPVVDDSYLFPMRVEDKEEAYDRARAEDWAQTKAARHQEAMDEAEPGSFRHWRKNMWSRLYRRLAWRESNRARDVYEDEQEKKKNGG